MEINPRAWNMGVLKTKLLLRIHIRRIRKYLVVSALFGFVIILSFVVLETTHRTITSRIQEYNKQTKILNPHVSLKPAYDVLLSGYMNSGSTFSGRFLGFRPDAFYMYEPLWHLSVWDYYKDNFTLCSSRVASCRHISSKEGNKNIPAVGPGRHMDLKILHDTDITDETAPLSIAQKILDHVFNCRLSQIASIIQPGVTSELKLAGPSWSGFNHCLYKKKKIETCLADLSDVCKSANHRVAKILRMSLHTLDPLLRDNPRLKIVHLFRDPRAVIHSRIETDGYPLRFSLRGSPEIRSNAKALCDKMASDIEEGKTLQKKYPNQFRFIHYEDIYNNENSLIKLHSLVGMAVTQSGLDQLRKGGHVNNPRRYAGKRRQHRTNNNAFWWTQFMQWGIIKSVDVACLRVYKTLGYPLFNSAEDLEDFDVNDTLSNLAYGL